MGVVRVKEGVEFSIISPGGFRILSALDEIARQLDRDVTITSGTDGVHSGPADPHKWGSAYDIRTQGDPDKEQLLNALSNRLSSTDQGRFYAFIEDYGGPNEHLHVQVRRGTIYP